MAGKSLHQPDPGLATGHKLTFPDLLLSFVMSFGESLVCTPGPWSQVPMTVAGMGVTGRHFRQLPSSHPPSQYWNAVVYPMWDWGGMEKWGPQSKGGACPLNVLFFF